MKNTSPHHSEFKKYQDIRNIARSLAEDLVESDKVEKTTDDLVELAGAIAYQDTSSFATTGDIKDLRNELKNDIKDVRNEIDLLRSDIKVFRRDIILWILSGTFAINHLPQLIETIIKFVGK